MQSSHAPRQTPSEAPQKPPRGPRQEPYRFTDWALI